MLVSADTDFGALLHRSGAAAPSAVLVRTAANRHPAAQAQLPLDNLPAVETALEAGALVVFEDTRIRVRDLPFGSG